MGFRGTLWRPDAQTTSSMRHGESVARGKSGSGKVYRSTEADAAAATRKYNAGVRARLHTAHHPEQSEEDRRFGQPHFGHEREEETV